MKFLLLTTQKRHKRKAPDFSGVSLHYVQRDGILLWLPVSKEEYLSNCRLI